MLHTRYSLFLESSVLDYSEAHSSWDFLDYIFFIKKSVVAPNLVEAVFFWDKIHTTANSFYNQKRKSEDSQTKIPVGLMRLSNHWSWYRKGIRYAPLCGYEKTEINNVWILGEWNESKTPEGWTRGYIKNILEGEKGPVAFVRFEGGDAYMPTKIVQQFDFEPTDQVFIKWFEGDRSKVVYEVKFASSCFEPKRVGDMGNFRNEMKRIRREIKVAGYKLMSQILMSGTIGNKNARLEFKSSSSGEEKWKVIKSVSRTDQEMYSLTVVDSKGVAKQVDLDARKKVGFKLTFENDQFEFYFTILEILAEIYRYKRKFIDGQEKFDF